MAWLSGERAVVRELAATCHTPVGVHADSVRIRGFAGLPDGSEWLVDEVVIEGGDTGAAGAELARRMLAAGAADLLRTAEAMAAR
jgi:hydroxymethylbilane synthase